MKTPPLGFTEGNFCAVLNGAKTETRRLLTVRDLPQELVNEFKSFYQDGDGNWIGCSDDSPNHAEWVKKAYPKGSNQGIKSKYQVGDRCYLTEPTQIVYDESFGSNHFRTLAKVDYFWFKAERLKKMLSHDETLKVLERKTGIDSKQNPRFMLKSFARYHVEITEVRLERLLDITFNSAVSEGIKYQYFKSDAGYYRTWYDYTKNSYRFKDPINSYLSEIAAIHKPTKDKIGGWDLVNSNPWVWVYKFKIVEAE